MLVCQTPRLRLRRFVLADAAFVLRLLNEPSFLEHIGDRGVRTLDDARAYLRDGPMASYAAHGFGLNAVELRADGTPIGTCGVLRRAELEAPDLGYAFVPEHWGRGYAREAAAAALADARATHGLERVLAITSPANAASIRLLERLGFRYEGPLRLAEDDVVHLYAHDAPNAGGSDPLGGPGVARTG